MLFLNLVGSCALADTHTNTQRFPCLLRTANKVLYCCVVQDEELITGCSELMISADVRRRRRRRRRRR